MRNGINTLTGFTVIELLVVMAIMALLVAVAIPNLREARVAADISQVKSDHMVLEQGLEAYRIDQQTYPRMNEFGSCLVPANKLNTTGHRPTLERLTTPIAYLSNPAPFEDPFQPTKIKSGSSFTTDFTPSNPGEVAAVKKYFYTARNANEDVDWDDSETSATWYMLESSGPAPFHYWMRSAFALAAGTTDQDKGRLVPAIYNSTNGTISYGAVWRVGGAPEGKGRVFAPLVAEQNSSRVHDWAQHEE